MKLNIRILALILLMLPGVSYAAVDMFLDISNVQGESKDDDHSDEIDVLAWSWGTSSDGRTTCVQDIGITKWVDLSSPTLLMGQMMGTVYEKAILTVRKAGETPLEYIVIEFNNVYVTSISTGGSGGEDRLTENMSLKFEFAKFKYIPQSEDGKPQSEVVADIYPGSRCK
jgi:type VI secretion system secreted protein Hcp